MTSEALDPELHLERAMPFPMERRRNDRYLTNVPVRCRMLASGVVVTARSFDLGENGIMIKSRRRIPEGSAVDLDVEVIMPVQVRLGFDLDSLVIDGPSVSHFARLSGVVRHCERHSSRYWDVGVEFSDHADPQYQEVVELFLNYLRDSEGNRM